MYVFIYGYFTCLFYSSASIYTNKYLHRPFACIGEIPGDKQPSVWLGKSPTLRSTRRKKTSHPAQAHRDLEACLASPVDLCQGWRWEDLDVGTDADRLAVAMPCAGRLHSECKKQLPWTSSCSSDDDGSWDYGDDDADDDGVVITLIVHMIIINIT